MPRKKLKASDSEQLLETLAARFQQFMNRHSQLEWSSVQGRLLAEPAKMWSLFEMERTGGEPDVVGQDLQTGQLLFFDCSPESPLGRRSLCYDKDARQSRKEHQPVSSAVELAGEMGIELLNEAQYRQLQQLGPFDSKTSSWLQTPPQIRKLGGAIFGDFRYGQVFVYHNGAQSYYAARAFRGRLLI